MFFVDFRKKVKKMEFLRNDDYICLYIGNDYEFYKSDRQKQEPNPGCPGQA